MDKFAHQYSLFREIIKIREKKRARLRHAPSITFIPISRILSTILLSSDSHLSGPAITRRLKRRSRTRRARPCIQVRILPLHSRRCRQDLSRLHGIDFSFQKNPSLFAPLTLLWTGVTRYLSCSEAGECSDFPMAALRRPLATQ